MSVNLATLVKNTADAIRAKKGTSALINPQDFPSEIASIPTPIISEQPNDVIFIDYDGTILHSYSKSDFLALEALPGNPTRKGLTAQGWNWTLSDAKTYVGKYTKLVIGQNYITNDGKTRLYITIPDDGRLSPTIFFQQTVANGVEVDWGDGTVNSSSSTGAVSISHTYEDVGDYVITLNPVSGTLTLGQGSTSGALMGGGSNRQVYRSTLKKVEVGTASFSANTFYDHKGLQEISIPTGTQMVLNTFYSCVSLKAVVVPAELTSMATATIFGCYSVEYISLPDSIATINANIFSNMLSIGIITIPSSITAIPASAFNSCYSVSLFIIPASVSSIAASAFTDCYGVKVYDFSTHTSVPSLADVSAFTNIPSDCKIIVPDNLIDTWKAATNWSDYASYIVSDKNKESYNFRAVPAPIKGKINSKLMTLVGGTVAWNQLFDFRSGSSQWKQNGTTTNVWTDGVLTMSNAQTAAAYIYQDLVEKAGHKFMYFADGKTTLGEGITQKCALSIYASGATTDITKTFDTARTQVSGIFESATDFTNRIQLRPNNSANTLTVYACEIFDLTAMFGSTIADYIFTLEQGTTGTGVAWFRKYFNKPYYPFSTGSLLSVTTGKAISYGRNQFDKDTMVIDGYYITDFTGEAVPDESAKCSDFIPVPSSGDYFIVNPATSGRWGAWYDADKKYLGPCNAAGVKTAPNGTRYLRMTLCYNGVGDPANFCVTISDANVNGKYFPYSKTEYELPKFSFNIWDEVWELGGIDASNGQNLVSNVRIRSTNYNPIIPSTQYYVLTPKPIRVFFYTSSKAFISYISLSLPPYSATITSPADAAYFRWADASDNTTYNNDTCINVSNPINNGKYEPHINELRGIPVLESNNNLSYLGDTVTSDGEVTRNWKKVVLDGVNLQVSNIYQSGGIYYAYIALPETGVNTAANTITIIASGYINYAAVGIGNVYVANGGNNVVLCMYDQTITTSGDANSYFESHPLEMVYLLATPVTEQIEGFAEVMKAVQGGTEQLTDYAYEQGLRDVEIPVGQISKYFKETVN